ncbi:MAG: hypothetical protein JO069_16295 [Verrucomicrobia bacterium]|nr:hypothetical protein [Verrucomicrobiota bacterium]
MKTFFFASLFSLTALAMSASAQEFRTRPRVAPQPEPPRPAIEQNSNTDIVRKFIGAPNKLHLINPLAPPRYGSGAQVVAADPNDPRQRGRFWRLLSIPF